MTPAIDKLVYVYYLPLSDSLQRLFKLDELSAGGVDLEWWDLSAAFGQGRPGALSRPYSREIADFADFERRLDALPPRTGIVAVFPYEPRVVRVFREVTRRGLPLVCYVIGVLPTTASTLGRRILDNLDLLLRPRKLANFVARRAAFLRRRLGQVKEFDLVFAAGADAAAAFSGAGEVVPINHVDYDEVLDAPAAGAPPVDRPYAVFLDGNLPHHPDLAMLGVREMLDAGRYYAQVNAYFERLEKAHGVEIVVAAHPKADYAKNPFGGRRIFAGRTRELTEGCRFAVTTMSTSLGYAVLYGKPLVFFTTDDIMSKYDHVKLDLFPALFAAELGRRCVNLDRAEGPEALEAPAPDPVLYERYKYRFLVSRGAENRRSGDVILETLRKAAGRPAKVGS